MGDQRKAVNINIGAEIMDKNIAGIAAEVLGTDTENVIEHSKEITEIDGWYFWQPEKGGLSVLINSAGEKLAASSGVGLAEHIAEFKNGRRN